MKESFQLTSSDLHNLSDIFTITLVDKSEPDFSSKTFKLAKKDIDNFYIDKRYKKTTTLLQSIYDLLFDYTVFKKNRPAPASPVINITKKDIEYLIIQHIIANLELDFYYLWNKSRQNILIEKKVEFINLPHDIEYTFYIKMNKVKTYENTSN